MGIAPDAPSLCETPSQVPSFTYQVRDSGPCLRGQRLTDSNRNTGHNRSRSSRRCMGNRSSLCCTAHSRRYSHNRDSHRSRNSKTLLASPPVPAPLRRNAIGAILQEAGWANPSLWACGRSADRAKLIMQMARQRIIDNLCRCGRPPPLGSQAAKERTT